MHTLTKTIVFYCLLGAVICARLPSNNLNEDETFWKNKARSEVDQAMDFMKSINTNSAKNIIVFIGDGMSISTVTAARIYKAQHLARLENRTINGEESMLAFEHFPNVGLSKTYSVDYQSSDSAATGSAMWTGVKTNKGTLGFDNSVTRGDVTSQLEAARVDSVMKWAQDAGKATGFITTDTVTSATPAALYAHAADRDWESDADLPDGAYDQGVKDIALQLIMENPGHNIKVALGGGWKSFLPKNNSKMEMEGNRLDGKNLIDLFVQRSQGSRFVSSALALNDLDIANTDSVLGLFTESALPYDYKISKYEPEDETRPPSLVEMTDVATKILNKNSDGFFLLVENENTDTANHASMANTVVHEAMVLDQAVEKVLEIVDLDETLIIVTADHGHTLTQSGYSKRGSDIRGLVKGAEDTAEDGKPYTILSYANGPGFSEHIGVNEEEGMVERKDLKGVDVTSPDFIQASAVPKESETHSGTDVGIYAAGPFAHLVHGVHEQNYLAYVMAYSSCIGPYANDQGCLASKDNGSPSSAKSLKSILSFISCIFLLARML